MRGDLRHRRDYQNRIVERHLDAIPERGVDVAAIDVVDPEHVGDEQAVEAAALKDLRQPAPVLQVGVVDGTIARMSPKARRLMDHAVHVERVETNLFGHMSLPWLALLTRYAGPLADVSAPVRLAVARSRRAVWLDAILIGAAV